MRLGDIETYGELDRWIKAHPEVASTRAFARAIGKPDQTVYGWLRHPDKKVPEEILLLIQERIAEMSVGNAIITLRENADTVSAELSAWAKESRSIDTYLICAVGTAHQEIICESEKFDPDLRETFIREFLKDSLAAKFFPEVFGREVAMKKNDVLGVNLGETFFYEKHTIYLEPIEKTGQLAVGCIGRTENFVGGLMAEDAGRIKDYLRDNVPLPKGYVKTTLASVLPGVGSR